MEDFCFLLVKPTLWHFRNDLLWQFLKLHHVILVLLFQDFLVLHCRARTRLTALWHTLATVTLSYRLVRPWVVQSGYAEFTALMNFAVFLYHCPKHRFSFLMDQRVALIDTVFCILGLYFGCLLGLIPLELFFQQSHQYRVLFLYLLVESFDFPYQDLHFKYYICSLFYSIFLNSHY